MLSAQGITLENIDNLLSIIGCTGYHQQRGEHWDRVFINVPQESGVPLSLGRVMFENGTFSHVNWYCYPDRGVINDAHRHYFNFYLAVNNLPILEDLMWGGFVKSVTNIAQIEYNKKVQAREALPKFKANGKMIRRSALAPPNQCKEAYKILTDLINDSKE
ncbi:MAG: hypothetical protein GQ570_04055 [Helicobacteraceae bacterium]|nr:hypothetical protein [Helicobacteraceae bacterium]